MKHIKQLVLTPECKLSGRVFRVSGGIDVAGPNVMPVVARDGYPQHTTLFSIPLTDVFLDPKLDLRWTNGVC